MWTNLHDREPGGEVGVFGIGSNFVDFGLDFVADLLGDFVSVDKRGHGDECRRLEGEVVRSRPDGKRRRFEQLGKGRRRRGGGGEKGGDGGM